jgi:hypothetical protein
MVIGFTLTFTKRVRNILSMSLYKGVWVDSVIFYSDLNNVSLKVPHK